MKKFWVSWYQPEELWEVFVSFLPHWCSGYVDSNPVRHIFCAAVVAENEEAAQKTILGSFDTTDPVSIEWRFCNERAADWSPFCGRFPKGDWMLWPEPGNNLEAFAVHAADERERYIKAGN